MMDWISFVGIGCWCMVSLLITLLQNDVLTIIGMAIAMIGFVVWAIIDTKRCLENDSSL